MEMSPLNGGETDKQIKKEKSRIVKIFLVKYKCLLIVIFLVLAIFQMVYLLINKVTSDSGLMTTLLKCFNSTKIGELFTYEKVHDTLFTNELIGSQLSEISEMSNQTEAEV